MFFTFRPPAWAGLSGYVAELGAAFACAKLGLSLEPRPDHAAYLASWIGVLRASPRTLFSIAAKAQAAVDYFLADSN